MDKRDELAASLRAGFSAIIREADEWCPLADYILVRVATLTAENERLRAALPSDTTYTGFMDEIDTLRERIAGLEAALRHYAKRDMWTAQVIDKWSGQCWLFDWPGDLAEYPWEFADRALTPTAPRPLSGGSDDGYLHTVLHGVKIKVLLDD